MAPKVRRSGRKINTHEVIIPEQVEIEKKNEDGDHKINIVEARPSAPSEVAQSTQIEADYKRLMACWGDVKFGGTQLENVFDFTIIIRNALTMARDGKYGASMLFRYCTGVAREWFRTQDYQNKTITDMLPIIEEAFRKTVTIKVNEYDALKQGILDFMSFWHVHHAATREIVGANLHEYDHWVARLNPNIRDKAAMFDSIEAAAIPLGRAENFESQASATAVAGVSSNESVSMNNNDKVLAAIHSGLQRINRAVFRGGRRGGGPSRSVRQPSSQNNGPLGERRSTRSNKSNIECFTCHKLGHYSYECRQNLNSGGGTVAAAASPNL